MRWFMNMRTGTKVLFGFGIMIVMLLTVILVSYRTMSDLRTSEENINNVQLFMLENIARVSDLLDKNRIHLLTMMLSKSSEEKEKLKQNIYKNVSEIEGLFIKLKSNLALGEKNLNEITSMEKSYESRKLLLEEQILPLVMSNDTDKALAIQFDKNENFVDLERAIQEMSYEAQRTASESVILSAVSMNKAVQWVLSIGLFAIIVAGVITFTLSRLISDPLKNMSTISKYIATGDLSQDVTPIARKDEFGAMAKDFQSMIINLRKLTSEIFDAVNVVGSSTTEISATTGQLAASASEIASAVNETTSTIEEIKQTAQITSQKAKGVVASSEKCADASEAGKKAANDIRDMISRIQAQMTLIAESMVRLNEQSQAIGAIIATVDDLAQQSNLLSVNASIEAAKAGEHGKGFSVVAQEVKSLATQSKQATSQVRTILNDIQKATSAAVMATEQGGKSVEAGVKKCDETSDAILNLVGSVAGASQAATQIATSSHQQLVGMEQAAIAMENIKQASAQNVDSTSQLKAAAQQLKEMGDKLKNLVGLYKLKRTADTHDNT